MTAADPALYDLIEIPVPEAARASFDRLPADRYLKSPKPFRYRASNQTPPARPQGLVDRPAVPWDRRARAWLA